MIQGIYTASMGMVPLMQKQDQIANNLANINTTGFKQSNLFAKTYQKYLANDQKQPFANIEMKPDEVFIDYSEGPMKATSSPMDLAIHGSGFFTVMTADGVQYTRNGNFSVNNEGMLVTSDGSKVMGTDGYIRLDRDHQVTVTDKGEITQEGATKGFLKIVDFKKPYQMVRAGESRMHPLEPGTPQVASPGFAIQQGYLEGANVSVVKNMVEMISAYRNFESDQKALLAQDETLEKAVNSVGRIG
jgi:flagellar basal-body rod protein FlgF